MQISDNVEIVEETSLNIKYLEATNYYNNGCLKMALNIFYNLILKDPFKWEFWFSIAAIHQLEKNYDESIISYKRSAILNPNEAKTYFHLAECLLSINEKKKALFFLDIAKKYCIDTILKDKILVLIKQNKSN